MLPLFFVGSLSAEVIHLKNSAGKILKLDVEVAKTAEERERGLMFRRHLAEGKGMIFFFPEATRTSFWMKNTPLSLDILFIRDGRIVDIVERAKPNSEEILTPKTIYDVVLEVPAGYAAKHRIQIGNRLFLSAN